MICIQNGTLHTMEENQGTIRADLLIRDDKIVKISDELSEG